MSFKWNERLLSTKAHAMSLKQNCYNFVTEARSALGFVIAARRLLPRICLGHFAKGKPLILRRADFDLESFGDAVGVGVDEFLFAAFDEEADFGLGAGVAEQDAAFAIE